jgi:hypothetical protein
MDRDIPTEQVAHGYLDGHYHLCFGHFPSMLTVSTDRKRYATPFLKAYTSNFFIKYGLASNSARPSGAVIAAIIKALNDGSNTYRIVGDGVSVYNILRIIASSCNSNQSTPYTFHPTVFFDASDNSSRPHPEEIIQFYRASSFALSLDGYNNSMALASNAPLTNYVPPTITIQSQLPTNIDSAFLGCLNSTIGNNLLLVNPPPPHHLSGGAIAGIVIGSLAGANIVFVLLILSCTSCAICCIVRKDIKSEN